MQVDITLAWPTWTDFAYECGLSRLWGGLHFMSAIEASREFAPKIGKKAYKFVTRHIEGNVAPLPPAPADSWWEQPSSAM